MWRSNRDEKMFSDSQRLAWDLALPFKHIPILDSDEQRAKSIAEFLDKTFTAEELRAAAVRKFDDQSDFRARLIGETTELAGRIKRLKDFLGQNDPIHMLHRMYLEKQLYAMEEYRMCLLRRQELFNSGVV